MPSPTFINISTFKNFQLHFDWPKINRNLKSRNFNELLDFVHLYFTRVRLCSTNVVYTMFLKEPHARFLGVRIGAHFTLPGLRAVARAVLLSSGSILSMLSGKQSHVRGGCTLYCLLPLDRIALMTKQVRYRSSNILSQFFFFFKNIYSRLTCFKTKTN